MSRFSLLELSDEFLHALKLTSKQQFLAPLDIAEDHPGGIDYDLVRKQYGLTRDELDMDIERRFLERSGDLVYAGRLIGMLVVIAEWAMTFFSNGGMVA